VSSHAGDLPANRAGRDVGTADECSGAQKEERKRGIIFEDAIPVRCAYELRMSQLTGNRESTPALRPG
jgi:hypothetical protein